MTYAHTHRQKVRAEQRANQSEDRISLGYHPETGAPFSVSDKDRQSGVLITGVTGAGKSGLLTNMIVAEATRGDTGMVVIDPHGDLTKDCIARLPDEALARTFVLDMTDESYPFGISSFPNVQGTTAVAQARAVDRIMHVFEALWPDVLTQLHLPRYLRAAILVLLANPGATLPVMYRFLLDDTLRASMLKNVPDEGIKDFWRTQYDELPMAMRIQRVGPLLNRSESLFLGRSLVRNILGQSESKLDFRKVGEHKEVVFIPLPTKTLAVDSRLIGTLIVAQIHAALFSFADLPEENRPGLSLYIDEFEHFVTKDIDELFTQGRKFCSRTVVANQYRGQLPDYLQASTMMARTKVCFQMVPEDARKVAQVFPEQEVLQPEHIEKHPFGWLIDYGSDDETVQRFIDVYLRSLHTQPRKEGKIEIITPGIHFDNVVDNMIRGALSLPKNREHPTVNDPTPFLNHLLYDCMKYGDGERHIPLVVAYGFSNCGNGFYPSLRWTLDKQTLLSNRVPFPPYLVVEGVDGKYWARLPEGHKEQLWHFVWHLRQTMRWLAANPIGRKTRQTTFDIANMITQLPRRAAFIRSGDEIGVIYTDDTIAPVSSEELHIRLQRIQEQTRQKYCRAKTIIEEELRPTVEADEALKVSRWEVME